MMEKGKESEFPEGREGSGIREADSDDRGVPLELSFFLRSKFSELFIQV
jgi:hypothetical protein